MFRLYSRNGGDRMKNDGKSGRRFFTDLFVLLAACCTGAFATTAVMIPNGLTSGGLTGIVRILQTFIPLDFSVMYYALAIVIWIVVVLMLGMKEGRKVLIVTLMYPAVLIIFEKLDFQLLEEKDIILAAIFCGLFSGVCSGLVFWRGYAFCGTESVAKILKKKLLPHVAISKILFLLDASIIILSAFIFGRNIALYALITQFISSKMVDYILYGFETRIVQMQIITAQTEAVAGYIMNDMHRGVSSCDIVGEYTGKHRKQLLVLCSPRESMVIKNYLMGTDPAAFVTVMQVNTVWGEGRGFTDISDEI